MNLLLEDTSIKDLLDMIDAKIDANKKTLHAVQWHKHGDHPAVSPFDNILIIGDACNVCGCIYAEHGILTSTITGKTIPYVVCPGSWICNAPSKPSFCCLDVIWKVIKDSFRIESVTVTVPTPPTIEA